MSIFKQLRQWVIRGNLGNEQDHDRLQALADKQSAHEVSRAETLLSKWDSERVEDVRRIRRTGNFVEGWIVPEHRENGR